MNPPPLSSSTQHRLVHNLMLRHPLPWRLEFDWTVEVTDAAGAIVIKCMHIGEANEIIAMATVLAADMAEFSEEFERMIAEGGAR